jgi:hypothetical protein
MCLAFPDVCKVPAPPAPPIPTPFPNVAQCAGALATTCTTKVKILNQPVLHKGSEIPMTQGDEAGVGGGVVSGTFGQKASYRSGVSKVKVEGNDIVTVLLPTAHNGSNANAPAGAQIAPSQAKVVVIP